MCAGADNDHDGAYVCVQALIMTMEQASKAVLSHSGTETGTGTGESMAGIDGVMRSLDADLVRWLEYILKTKIKFGKSRVANGRRKGVAVPGAQEGSRSPSPGSTDADASDSTADIIRRESLGVGAIAQYLVSARPDAAAAILWVGCMVQCCIHIVLCEYVYW